MLYSILIYGSEALMDSLAENEIQTIVEEHREWQKRLSEAGQLGPFVRLMPTTTALTISQDQGAIAVLDGPFAETKEQLIGIYLVDCDTLKEAVSVAKALPLAVGPVEVRPIQLFGSGVLAQAHADA